MNRKLKILSLSVMASLAFSVVAVSMASAEEFHSTSKSGTTYLTQTQVGTNQLDTEAGAIKCTTLGGSGSFSGTTVTEFEVTNLTASGCTAFGLAAHIDYMGCSYLVTRDTPTTGIIHLKCPTTAGGVTDQITVTPTQGGIALCHIYYPEQTYTTHFTLFSNRLFGRPTGPKIYEVVPTNGTTKCGTAGLHTSGEGTGEVQVAAYEDKAHSTEVKLTYE